MTAPSNQMTTDGAARSVQAPTAGWADVTTSTTKESIDLSAWAGRYVTIYVRTADHAVFFDEDGSTSLVTGAAATVGTVGVPADVTPGGPLHCVVPKNKPFLNYATVSGSGEIRVLAS